MWVAFYIVAAGGLTVEQQENNGDMFYQTMSSYGFSAAACAAIWSNILHESGGNPMAWETGRPENGRGLVQWTPSTKLSNWAADNNLNPDSGDVQCRRIYLEFSQPSVYEQYYSTGNFPVSAGEFMGASADASRTIEWWSEAFTRNYERPNEQAFQSRKEAQFADARKYYQRFSGEQPPSGSYRVTVSVSGQGSASISPSKTYYEEGEQITLNPSAYSGQTLEGVSSSPDVGVSTSNFTFTMPAANVVITVTFSGSGDGGGEEPEVVEIVLRLVENNNLEAWKDGKIFQYCPNRQNTFTLKVEVEKKESGEGDEGGEGGESTQEGGEA